MLYSTVPALIIRAECPALISINGRLAGECGPDAYISAPLSANGDYYIEMQPLLPKSGGVMLRGVTRKFTLENGIIMQQGYEDAHICFWPGGVDELIFCPGALAAAPGGEAITLDAITPTLGGKRFDITLYRDNETKLSVVSAAQGAACYALGQAQDGMLGVNRLGGNEFISVRLNTAQGERLILLDDALRQALDISGTRCIIEGDTPTRLDSLGTVRAHERRIRYAFINGAFEPAGEEIGFFTHDPIKPQNRLERAAAFAQANMLHLEAEALSFLAPELSSTLSAGALGEFFGDYVRVCPPPGDLSGDTLGLIAPKSAYAYTARLFAFEHGEAGIENITEI